MSVRETPKANRYLDLKEKERAYRKHMEAVANARPTIDTSTPDCPNRLRVKEKADAHYRRQVLTDYSKRERMIASAKDGKRNNQEIFPDNYYPDEDDIDFDELVKKYGGDNIYQEEDKKDIQQNNKNFEKTPHKTEKIHFGDGKVQIEEEDAEDITANLDDILNDNIDDLTKKSKPQNKDKGTPNSKSRASSKIPVSRKSNSTAKSSPKSEDNSKKKKDDKTAKSPKKVEKQEEKNTKGLLDTSMNEKKFTSSTKKKTLQNTASSTMSFADDFEDDFENDQTTEEEKDNFDEPASASESESTDTNKFEEEKNESDKFSSNDTSDSEDTDKKKKSLELTENDTDELDKTEPMSNPIAKLAEDQNSDDMPELDFPDF